ncbi:hypothetical protein ABIE41_003442 [Bosea sp. OAE506]
MSSPFLRAKTSSRRVVGVPGAPPSVLPSRSFGLVMPVAFLLEIAKGGAVPDHVDHDRVLARLGRGVLDDGVDVAEAGVIGAAHDAGDSRARALALVDDDVEPLGLVVALVASDEEGGVRALRLPAQGELDRGLLRLDGAGEGQPGHGQAGSGTEAESFQHLVPLFLRR